MSCISLGTVAGILVLGLVPVRAAVSAQLRRTQRLYRVWMLISHDHFHCRLRGKKIRRDGHRS